MEESAEIAGRLEKIGALTREGAPRSEVLAEIRGLIEVGAEGAAGASRGAVGVAPPAEDTSDGGPAPGADDAGRAGSRGRGVAVS